MVVGLVFPYMKQGINLFGSFLVFGGFTIVCFIYYVVTIRETKGKDRYEVLKSYCSAEKYKEFEKQANEYAAQAFEE